MSTALHRRPPRIRHFVFGIPLFAWFVACGESAGSDDASGGGGTSSGGVAGLGAAGAGSPPTGGTSSGGASSGSGGMGAAPTGGTAGFGGSGQAGQGGDSATGGGAGSGLAGSGGSGSGGDSGSGGTPSGGAGGMPRGGSGGTSGGRGGANGGSGGGPVTCTRDLLDIRTGQYFTALEAHDASSLQLGSTVKFTENGEVMELGEEGLWLTAGRLVYKHSAFDVEACSAMSQAVVPDGATNIPFALRLKLVAGLITEIETIAVRPGDYSLGASNTAALAASGTSVGWETVVPAASRNTREEIVAWMNKYFRMFPAGVCNTTSACRRIENGGGNFTCTAGASCSPNQPGPNDDELVPRLILADVERGLGVGFTMFQGNTDMHVFKMSGGQVHGVSAVLGQAGMSGW